jgi:hypothetical protein
MKMISAATLATVMALVAAKIPTLEMPAVTNAGRNLLEIAFEELDFPVGEKKHLALASTMADVDGVPTKTMCAPCASPAVESPGIFGKLA